MWRSMPATSASMSAANAAVWSRNPARDSDGRPDPVRAEPDPVALDHREVRAHGVVPRHEQRPLVVAVAQRSPGCARTRRPAAGAPRLRRCRPPATSGTPASACGPPRSRPPHRRRAATRPTASARSKAARAAGTGWPRARASPRVSSASDDPWAQSSPLRRYPLDANQHPVPCPATGDLCRNRPTPESERRRWGVGEAAGTMASSCHRSTIGTPAAAAGNCRRTRPDHERGRAHPRPDRGEATPEPLRHDRAAALAGGRPSSRHARPACVRPAGVTPPGGAPT